MKKHFACLLLALPTLATLAKADTRYCEGTSVSGPLHDALQETISRYAERYDCHIGSNCILNFQTVRYHIAWDNRRCGEGSTFVCRDNHCYPEFSAPRRHRSRNPKG